MRIALAFLLLVSLRLSAVEWIHFGGAIETNGWTIRLTNGTAPNLDATTAANTNLQFFNGFTTNNTPSATNGLTVTWTDMGWDSNGVAITRQETNYGTKLLREPYPMQFTNSIYPLNTTNNVMWIALSKQISSRASNITVSILAGAWASTNGASFTNCMATNFTVVNESLQNYRKIHGNWSPGVPMFSRVTNTMRLRAVAFHQSARDWQPVQLIRFITTGLISGVKVTNDVTEWSVDHEFNARAGLPIPISPGEAIADVDLSGMTELENVRSDFQIFSHLGDTIIDTTTDSFPIGHPREAALLNKYDPNNAHSRVIAVVDEVNGTNATARCATNVAPTDISPNQYFLTIGAALNQGAASNNTFYAHNDVSGMIIYVKSTTTNILGTTVTATTMPTVAPILRPYPGDTATLTHNVGGLSGLKRVRFEGPGINCAWAASQIPFNAYSYVSFENCTSAVTVSTAPYLNVTNSQFIHCTIRSFASGLFAGASGSTTAHSLRGCWLKGFATPAVFRTWIGNYHGDTNDGPGYSIASGRIADSSPDGNRILYNNWLGGEHLVGPHLTIISNTFSHACVVQNVFEKCYGGERVGSIATTGSAYTNYLDWHNLYEGGRIADYASEQTETAVIPRVGFSVKNTIWAYPGQKSDTDGASPDAIRWANSAECNHMVDGEGNFYIRNNVTATATAFRPAFAGMKTFEPGYTNVDNYMQFIDRKAALVGTSPLGGGNYKLQASSPALNIGQGAKVLPFDLEGNPRGQGDSPDPPGPYIFYGGRPVSIFGPATFSQ